MSVIFMSLSSQSASVRSESAYGRLLAEVPRFTWRVFGDGVELEMYAFFPPNHSREDAVPSMVFFHGGMWRVDSMAEFVPWATVLARRGVACFLPVFRTRARFEVSALDVLDDAEEAWLWVRENAAELGLDPHAVSVAGCDAGALMALHVAMPPVARKRRWLVFRSKEPLPPMPASVAIFRGVVDLNAPEAARLQIDREMSAAYGLNPVDLLRPCLPPLFSAHGMQDSLMDCHLSEWFAAEWKGCGNAAMHVSCPLGDHAFLHFNVNPQVFEQVMASWDAFLVSNGVWPEADDPAGLLLL